MTEDYDAFHNLKEVEVVLKEDAIVSETKILLVEAGFSIGASFDELGVIYGSVELDKIGDLESLSDVISVKEEGTIKAY